MDGLEHHTGLIDFQSLGFDAVHGVSATHGQGVQALLEEVTAPFPANEVPLTSDDVTTTIAFVGRPNVGKSTLINRILGEDRVVVYDMPGTTRDSIFVPFVRDKTSYVLVDTAGVRRRSRVGETMEKFSIIKTLQSIKAAQVCLMVIDAKEGLTDQDLHLLGYIIETGKALVIAVNKWDGLDEDHKEHVKSELDRKLKFAHFATINFISALHGSGVGLLFKAIDAAYRSAMQTFSTPSITRILQDLVMQHAPPTVNGRRIKLRYAHVGGHNPPVIIVHGNQLEMLPESYKRYLMKGFLEQLKLVGTPLKIQFKQGANPYKNKKNALNARQLKKKNRLMRWVKKK
jgi:GTP-binding protein